MKKATSLRLHEDIVKRVSARAKAHRRTLTNQIEEYIMIAMDVEENPYLPYSFIKETIEAKEEIKAGLGVPYKFGIIK
ncbi:MAG: hypothetical protein Q8K51_15910 [Nitrospirota bacterium]|nr:hypothetical protein [Nitrospirota bacterium]